MICLICYNVTDLLVCNTLPFGTQKVMTSLVNNDPLLAVTSDIFIKNAVILKKSLRHARLVFAGAKQ